MRTKIISAVLAVVLVLALGGAASAETVLTWNELNDETYGAAVGAKVFDETLRELSGGAMSIDLYLEGGMGSEDISLEGLKMGTLDIFRGNASSLKDYGAEIISATGLPYLFSSMDEFERMAASPLGQEILDSVEAADCGFIALAWMVEGPRNLFITQPTYEKLGEPEAFSIDLLKDLKIRVPGTEMMITTMRALGAQPIEITYSELERSLRSGNIDGAENGIIPYLSLGFCDAAPYFITDAHTFGCGVILVSSDVWNSLTEEEQGWMRAAGKAASDACYEYNLTQEKACLASFASRGVTALPVTDLEEWQAACADLYSSQSAEVQALIERIQTRVYE